MRDAMDRLIETIAVTQSVVPNPLDLEEFYELFRQKTTGRLRSASLDELISRESVRELAYA